MPAALTFDGLLSSRRDSPNGTDAFVTQDGQMVSPADFDALVGRAAGWLQANGIGAGDRIAIWLPNHIDWMALLFGAARISAVVAAVNTRYRTAELHHILKSAGAKMLIFEQSDARTDFSALIEALDTATLPDLEILAVIDGTDLPAIGALPVRPCNWRDAAELKPQGATPDDPVLLFTTSGTTSAPKLVLHSQKSLVLHAVNCAPAYAFDAPDARYLAVLPFSGVFGLNPTLAAIAGGAQIYLNTVFDLECAITTAKTAAITHFFGSDDMFRMMWKADRAAFDHARLCGFATFTPGLKSTLHQMAADGLPLCGLYGASEVNAIFAMQPVTLPLGARLEGGGRTASREQTDVRVRNTDTGALCPVGETGLLEIKASTNFTGYFRNPEATAKTIDAEGYFRSGDIGYLNADGTFTYLARGGDFIRLSGFLTDPREIEEVIQSIEGVTRAQVVGVTWDGKTRPVAFVTIKSASSPTEETILASTKDQLAHYKVPVFVKILDEFPTVESANGLKIRKGHLRDMATGILTERNT